MDDQRRPFEMADSLQRLDLLDILEELRRDQMAAVLASAVAVGDRGRRGLGERAEFGGVGQRGPQGQRRDPRRTGNAGCDRAAERQPQQADPLRVDSFLPPEELDGHPRVRDLALQRHFGEFALRLARAVEVKSERRNPGPRESPRALDEKPV